MRRTRELALLALLFVVAGLWSICLWSLSVPGAAAAPTTTTTAPTATTVSGTLTAAGKAVAGARITASQNGKLVAQAVSDSAGTWTLAIPRPGTYQLELNPNTLPPGVTAARTVLPSFRVFGGFPQHALFPLTLKGSESVGGPSRFDQLLNLFVSGVRFGLIVALCAVGLSLIYATTGLVNFANGELVTFGALIAYLASTMSTGPRLSLVFAAIVGVAATGLLGALCELAIFRPMVHRRSGAVSRMLVSIGLALFLRYLYEIVFGICGKTSE